MSHTLPPLLYPRSNACLAIHLTKFHPLFCRQKRGGVGRSVGRSVGGLACERRGRRQLQTVVGGISPGANELGLRERKERERERERGL